MIITIIYILKHLKLCIYNYIYIYTCIYNNSARACVYAGTSLAWCHGAKDSNNGISRCQPGHRLASRPGKVSAIALKDFHRLVNESWTRGGVSNSPALLVDDDMGLYCIQLIGDYHSP